MANARFKVYHYERLEHEAATEFEAWCWCSNAYITNHEPNTSMTHGFEIRDSLNHTSMWFNGIPDTGKD